MSITSTGHTILRYTSTGATTVDVNVAPNPVTWNEVNGTWASWTAVNANNATWAIVRDA